jgi:PAS domain S-box-containing protein
MMMQEAKMTPAKLLGLLLVIVYVVGLKVLSVLDIGSIFEHRLLLPIMNTLFAGLIPVAISLIAGRVYSKSGSSTVLFMGCGMLSFGLCAISAGWLIRASDGANLNVTVYNTGAFLGSIFHATGAILSLVGIGYPDEIGKRRLGVVLAYLGITIFVICFSLAALRGLIPPFFIQGAGPTELRQAILGSAVLLYVVSSIFLMAHYFKRKTDFLYWYSLCLAMLAIGLFAFFVQKSVGSPIGWLGRSANYFGGIFALVAVLWALRDARSKGAHVEQSVADLFQGLDPHYRYGFLAVLPIPIFLILLIIMASLGVRTVFEPPGLFAGLNILFLTILPLSAVYFATRGYFYSGVFTLLMLGSGTLTLGLGGVLSVWILGLEGGGSNAGAIVLNSAFLLSAIFQTLGGVSAFIGRDPNENIPQKRLIVAFSYMGIAFLMVMLGVVTLKGFVPPFFVKGVGPTALRQVVIGVAAILFGVSGLLLLVVHLFSRTRLFYWYSLALLLFTTALVCYLYAKFPGEPIAWLGRSSMFLSGIYLLVAVTSAARELRTRGESLETGIANLFRHRLEVLVEERTLQLSQAKEELEAARNELERANAELELRVKERTAELESANEKLVLEIENRERAEESVTAERKRLYAILETMPQMICLLTPDHHYAFVNRSFREKFGEHNGRHCFDLIFGKKEPCEFCEAYNVLQTGKPHSWEVEVSDGSVIDVYNFPFADVDGSPLILEIDNDVTVQRRAVEAVKAERQRLYDVLETLPVYVCLLDSEYRMPFANKNFRENFGESQGRRCYEFLFDRTEPCEICETYTVMKTGAPHHWRWTGPNERDYDIYDFPFIDADGSRLILEMGIDITERKRAEGALQEASAYNRRLIEASLDPLVTISAEGKITDANAATERVTGHSRSELLGTDFADYFTDPDKARFGYEKVFRDGLVKNYELAIRHKNGWLSQVMYNASLYRDNSGKIVGIFAAARDISDRKRAEEELIRSNEDLQQFAYVASHDLQEPLRNVASCLQLLEKEYKNKLDANADQYINYAIEGAVRMKSLILDLLAYSRVVTKGKEPAQTDCEQILERALKNLSLSITETGAVVTHDALPTISADDTQLLQVFQNLIQNAIKFRREAPPQVHVSAVRNKSEWVFSIKDNGIGIESRHLERIFVIFQRLHKRSEYDGTGMGLAISKKIVERHGGQIWAESEPHVGTTFYFTIPEKGLQI